MSPPSTALLDTLADSAAVPAAERAPMKAPSARLAALEMRASFEFMAFMASSPCCT